jgi:hypothetical protein
VFTFPKRKALEQFRQLDTFFEEAETLIETARSLIVDSTSIQDERAIALLTCPLLTRMD